MNDSRWKALYRPAAESNYHSFENLSCIFLGRVGMDLLSQEEPVFEPASKLIGVDKVWWEITGFFFDPETQREEYRELQEKILHDPTQILDIFQELLCGAESVAELCLVMYNLHMHVANSELKSLMLFATWSTIRWTQAMANQWIWERGTYRVMREGGQNLTINVNGHPFQLQHVPLPNEFKDSSGDIFRMDFLHCNFTNDAVGMVSLSPRMGNRFPYLNQGGHFRAAVSLTKEGLCVMETSSIESVGQDFGDIENQLRRHQKELIVFGSKYSPRTREYWKLTITTVDVQGRIVGVIHPWIEWLKPHDDFIENRTNPTTLRGYKQNFSAEWIGRLPMVVAPMKGSKMKPLDITLPKQKLFQRVKRKSGDVKQEPQE